LGKRSLLAIPPQNQAGKPCAKQEKHGIPNEVAQTNKPFAISHRDTSSVIYVMIQQDTPPASLKRPYSSPTTKHHNSSNENNARISQPKQHSEDRQTRGNTRISKPKQVLILTNPDQCECANSHQKEQRPLDSALQKD